VTQVLLEPKRVSLKLHSKQAEVYNSKARFKVIDCGRRFGKTHLEWVRVLTYMVDNPNCLIWWVAPFYKELAPATKKVKELTPKEIIADIQETANVIRYIRLVNGSECYFHSADREDSLRGSGLNGMVIDEAAKLKEDRWSGELEPSLMDFNGWCDFISTPKAKNWFYKLYCRGLDTTQTLYKSWCFSSYENAIENGGFLPKSNIDTIAADMPQHLRDQEIFGKFLEGEGSVFRNLTRQIRDYDPEVSKGEFVSIGADFGKTQDFTVLTGIRNNGEIVAFERFNTLDWDFQKDRTIRFCKQFEHDGSKHYQLLVDASGLGNPIYDSLRNEGLRVEPFKFTNTTKRDLIENLSHMIDDGKVWFRGDPAKKEFAPELRQLQSELEMFGYELGSTGTLYYGAPEGFHDDCVVSLALACWQEKHDLKPGAVWFDW